MNKSKPFTLKNKVRLPRYNKETEQAMQETREILSGKIETKSYNSARELFDELDSESLRNISHQEQKL
ncbi:MAG: hypothetical protein IJI57_14425 [Flexilinea sp.]|nr:hypothetical protein [Flexilinea sp.]